MNTQTLNKMKQMKLHGMAGTFSANVETGKWEKYTADELIALLIEAEWDERHNRKLDRSLKTARFRYKASVEQLSFDMERNLDKIKSRDWQTVNLSNEKKMCSSPEAPVSERVIWLRHWATMLVN